MIKTSDKILFGVLAVSAAVMVSGIIGYGLNQHRKIEEICRAKGMEYQHLTYNGSWCLDSEGRLIKPSKK